MKKLLLAFSVGLFLLAGCGELNEPEAINKAAEKAAVKYLRDQGGYTGSGYSTNQEDFNQDGRTDILLHLDESSELCTSQGCPLLVLENEGSKLKTVSVIRNVQIRLGQRDQPSGWPTFIVASGDPNGTAELAGDPASVYELVYDNGYPEDATQGVPYRRR